MNNMKYVLITARVGIRFKIRICKVEEEERTHYHLYKYNLPINKEDTITLIPKYLGHYSEARHMKNLMKSRRCSILNEDR